MTAFPATVNQYSIMQYAAFPNGFRCAGKIAYKQEARHSAGLSDREVRNERTFAFILAAVYLHGRFFTNANGFIVSVTVL